VDHESQRTSKQREGESLCSRMAGNA